MVCRWLDRWTWVYVVYKYKINILFFIILVLNTNFIFGHDDQLIATVPISREDGLYLPTTQISKFNLYIGDKIGEYNNSYTYKYDNSFPQIVLMLPKGYFTPKHIVLTTIDTGGRESLYSLDILVDFTNDSYIYDGTGIIPSLDPRPPHNVFGIRSNYISPN